jgi:hypothetical protein
MQQDKNQTVGKEQRLTNAGESRETLSTGAEQKGGTRTLQTNGARQESDRVHINNTIQWIRKIRYKTRLRQEEQDQNNILQPL